MDISTNGSQFIICECGDNFPNEKFLNLHLASGHGEVETYLCDECPEAFTSQNGLSRHKSTHAARSETPQKPQIKTYARKTLPNQRTEEVKAKCEPAEKKKEPPVIKLKNLKRIDSINLVQTLKSFGGIIKLETTENPPEPLQLQYVPEPELEIEPEQEPEPMEEAIMEDTLVVKKEATETEDEIYYQCDVCNSIFYTEWDFNVHYQSEHALKQEPSAEQILEQHLVSDHGTDVDLQAEAAFYYECELCHKIFASEKYFNIHYNKAHGGLLPVDEEDEMVEEPPTVEETMEPAEPEVEDQKNKAPEQVIYYKCDLCKILYPSEKAYNVHFNKKHGGQSCTEVQSPGFQLLEQELTECQTTGLPLSRPGDTFFCSLCPKSFTMKRSLTVHLKRVHFEEVNISNELRNANRSKVCDVCGRAYNSNAALRYHQRRHTGEKPYPCTICPKRFTMPMFLQIHLRTHTGEKPYECPHCPKAFTNKAALIRHDRVHTGVKPYPCPECGKFFTQSNSMKLHVSTVHLKLPAPYKSRSRRSKSEARALQLALKSLPQEELVLGE